MARVALNRYELRIAAMAGVERRVAAIELNRPAAHGAHQRRGEWQFDILGTISEYALAKVLGVYWQPASTRPLHTLPGDVGTLQVRSTAHPNGCLIVYETDNDHSVFVLAIVNDRHVDFKGWLYAYDAKQHGTPRHNGQDLAYWVEQHQLHPFDTLPFKGAN